MSVTAAALREELEIYLPEGIKVYEVTLKKSEAYDGFEVRGSYQEPGKDLTYFDRMLAASHLVDNINVGCIAHEIAQQLFPRPEPAYIPTPPPSVYVTPPEHIIQGAMQNAAYATGNDLPHPAPGPAQDAAPLGQGGNAAPAQETQSVERILDRFLATATAQLD